MTGSNTGIDQTRQGHTAHEMLDSGLTHMNGRLYDPVLARFVSADPHVDNPFDLQSLNRYSYVNNNPLGFTDPTGYFKLFGKRWSWWRDSVLKPVVAAWAGYYTFGLVQWGVGAGLGGGVGGYAVGTTAGALATGVTTSLITTGSTEGWQQNALSALLFYGVGDLGRMYNLAENGLIRAGLHAAAGCISASAGGGKCGQGALSAGFAQYGGSNLGIYDNIVTRVVLGGTASVIGGGKFGNGASTAAFGYLFNCVAHKCYELRNPEGGALSFYGTPSGSHFGQPSTLSALYDVEWRWSGAGESAKLEIGNISLERGGHPDHKTHQDGLDVDIRPLRTGGSGSLTWQSRNYDRAATQRLVDTIRSVSPNATIYFNDPKLNGVQPFPGHDNHLHVRFR